MNRQLWIVAAIFLGVSLSWASSGDHADFALQVQDNGDDGVTLYWQSAPVDVANFVTEGAIWMDDGTQIPVVTRWVAVPPGHRAEMQVNSHRTVLTVNGFSSEIDQLDELNLYPPDAVSVGEMMTMRGIPVVPVTIYPVQRNVDDDGIIENRRMELDVRFIPDASVNPDLQPINDHPNSSMGRMLDQLLINPPRRDPGEPQREYSEHILIIHQDDDLFIRSGRRWVDSLAVWKTQMGYLVSIEAVNVQQEGYRGIRNLIRSYYLDNEFPISQVILIGGKEEETIYIPTYQYGDNIEGDHFYTLMYDDDVLLGDITLGRFQAHSFAELAGTIIRSVRYERNPYRENEEDDWFSNGLYTAENIAAPGGQFVPSMVQLGRWIYSRMMQRGYTNFDTLWGNNVDEVVRPALENGLGLAICRGWLDGCLRNRIPVGTGRRNPFVCAITCLSYETQDIFFRVTNYNSLSGPVASICMWGFTNTKYNNSLSGGLTRGIRYFNMHQPGILQHFSKAQMVSDYRFDENAIPILIQHLAAYRLFGDPSVNIFYGTPVQLEAEHPERITTTTTGLNIYVTIDDEPAEDALVCVWQPIDDGIHFVTTPGDDGWARFTLDQDDLEEGELLLTITRPDAIPYTTAIEVTGAGIGMEGVEYSFDETTLFGDQIDNDDGLFGNGYTIPTMMTFINYSDDEVGDGSITLSSEDEWIAFDPQEMGIGRLEPEGEVEVEFDLSFDRASRHGRTVKVNVEVTADGGDSRWEHSFQLSTSGHDLEVQLVDGDIDPGRVTILEPSLRNLGDLSSPALTATLVYLPERWREDWIEVTRNTVTYRTIRPNQTLSQDGGRLQVSVSDLAIPGNYAQFMLTLEAQDGNDDFRDTIYFEKEIGDVARTDPVGPDAYGYICFDSQDGGNWEKAPRFQWREINPAKPDYDFEGERIELGDIYVDYDCSGVVVFPEEFHFQYYGQEFDTLIVCSNGWIAFGADQSMFVDFRNWQIPGNQGPDAQVCALWQDLINPQPGDRGVFTYYDEAAGIFIIEWSEVEIYAGPQDLLEFQIILYDSEQWATRTGDGEIKIQYKNVVIARGHDTDNRYSTVGLKNLDGSDGLEYCYWDNYAEAAWPLENELALLFTTEVELIVGAVEGRVTDAATGDPIEGAEVLVVPGGEEMVVTDADGNYRTENVRVGPNYVQVSLHGYNTTRRNVDIVEGETLQVNVALTHPEINVPGDEIHRIIRQQENTVASLQIGNDGNGPLTVNLSTRYRDGSPITYTHRNSIPISGLVEDERIYGCQFVWDLLYVTGSNRVGVGADTSLANWVYVFDKEGNETARLRQPTHGTMSFHDLAWDGRYLYGGEERDTSSSWLVVFDNQGHHIRDYIIEILNRYMNFPRALAYSPSRQTLFMASENSHIYEIALDGDTYEIVNTYLVRLPGEDISIYGMAWNEMDEETPLYIMDRTPTGDSGEMRLIKYNPETRRTRIVTQLAQYDTETGTGLSFSPLWEHGVYSLATVAGAGGGDFAPDTVRIYTAGPDCRFISYDVGPHIIDADGDFALELRFDAAGLRVGDYVIGLLIEHNAASDPVVVPVTLHVNPAEWVDENTVSPLEFHLSEAYPNPFNGVTRIDFMLNRSGMTRLAVYDLTGREVAVLADGEFNAGRYSVVFEADRLASGIYFYRLKSRENTIVKRMVLLR